MKDDHGQLKNIWLNAGRRSDREYDELSLLANVGGGNPGNLNAHSLSSGLPLDAPQPDVVVRGRGFCFTGRGKFEKARGLGIAVIDEATLLELLKE
jgi:hypothetical protein